jgi:hypothetical protein
MDEIDNDKLHEKMLKYKAECGCTLGAQLMSIAFVSSMAIIIYKYHFISLKFLSHLPFVLLFSICAAGIGKFIGIFYAKYKYNQLAKRLYSHHPIQN